MLKETIDSNPIVLETLNFANIVTRDFNKNKPSDIIPILKVAADHFGFNLSRELQFKSAKKYVIKCINCN